MNFHSTTRLSSFFLAMIFIATLFGCKKTDKEGNKLSVIYTSFKGEIDIKENLSFTFSQAIIKEDSLLDQWFSADYLTFKPSVSGKYKWVNKDELLFSPTEAFNYATDYTVILNESILKLNKQFNKWKGDQSFLFNTPYLALHHAYASWSKNETGQAQAKVIVFTNMPIESSILEENLKVSINGEEYPFTIKEKENSKQHHLLLSKQPSDDNEINVVLALNEVDEIGKKGSKIKTKLVPKDILKITKLEAEAEGIVSGIKVFTSQKIETEALKDKLEIQPKVDFEIESTYYGFFIKSEDIKLGNVYKVSIKKGLKGVLDGTLKKDFSQEVSFSEISPEINFLNDKGIYLGSEGNRNLNIRIVNTPKIKVSVYKVFDNNLMHFLQRGKNWGSFYNYDEETRNSQYYDYRYYETSDVGQLVYEEDMVTDNLQDYGMGKLLNFNFDDKLKDKDGLYVVKVEGQDQYYISDSKLISLSDIGMISKEDKDNIYVFTNSIKTANPIAGADITLISQHNQVITSQKTGADGIAKFSKSSFREGFIPRMVFSKKGSDFNYMDIQSAYMSTSRFDVGGKRQGEVPYDLYVYAERGLYRPGETINLAGIIRDYDWNVTGKMPVTITLKSPNGKEYTTSRKQLDEQGMFTCSFDILASSMTGTYYAEVHTGKDIHLGSKAIQVEEFMPDRIKVDVEIDNEEYGIEEAVKVALEANSYFGPPAAGRDYEVEYTLRQAYFSPKDFRDYRFSLNNNFRHFDEVVEGETDKQGKAELSFDIPKTFKNNGLLNGRIYATVFDETGRPVHRSDNFKIYTQNVFVGMGSFDRWAGLDKPLEMPLIAVNKDENSVIQEIEIEIIKYNWYSVLQNSGGRYRYESKREEVTIKKETITIPKDGVRYYFTPKTSGSYEVRARLPEANTELVRQFYAYEYGSTNSTSYEVDNEGRIDISFDKDEYSPGDKATAILKLPFDGKVLITTERDEVMSYVYMDSKDKVIKYPITVSDKNVPNTYVTATLIKPHNGNSLPLTVAHGFASYKVNPKNGKLKLDISATEKSRSKRKQTITIKSEPNAHLTVAVVDEGILALGNQKTPNPYDHFYAKRALSVTSSDIYPYLFPEITATGGDEAMFETAMENRQNPLKNKRVKLVSFWSDKLITDASGKVSFEIDIPQFSGSLRVMAVGTKNQMFGSAEENITVADPIVISSSIPRFLSMQDQWTMTVNVSNTTDKVANGKIKVNTEGPLEVVFAPVEQITIPANSEASTKFVVKAGLQMNEASITAQLEAFGESFTEDTDITIRPAASLVKTYSSGLIEANNTEKVNFSGNYIPSSPNHKIFISNSPLVQFTEDFSKLIDYPFGCLEQTVSKAFPQLYFEDLVEAVYNGQEKEVDKNEIKRNIQHAIDKIKTLQTSNGGLSYWPNSGDINWWSSTYALHFLLEAKARGYQVPNKTINRLKDYLKFRLKQKEEIVYYYNGNLKKTIVKKEIAYSLYVLAFAGQPDISTMKHYLSHTNELSLDAKYLLACAFILIDDMASARKLLPAAFEGEQAVPVFGGSFYSYIRDIAIATNALIEAQPDHPQIPDLIKLLSKEMGNKKYLNTQESAFGFLALGKYARLRPIGKATATISRSGSTLANFDGKDIWYELKDTNEPVEIEVKGEGSIYYFVESEGIPIDGKVPNKDNYLQVRRTFYNRDKEPITNGKFKQNDLIVVKITLKSLTGKRIENVAVTDILPAGFEIENARITEMPDLSWVNTNMSYDHRDIRDDRIHFFTTAGSGTSTFYYLVRAVTPGTYQLGPVSADAMYNGEYHSYYGSERVVVE